MANDKAVSLKQFKTAVIKLQEYVDNNYSTIKHKHNDLYYTRAEIDNLTISSDSIVLDGYTVAEESGPILNTDSLSVAIGKLEKALENTSKGDIEKAKQYTDEKIAEATKDIASLEDLRSAMASLESTLKHKTGDGYNHIPSGGEIGQILRNVSPGTAEWSNVESLEANSNDVKKMLDDIF